MPFNVVNSLQGLILFCVVFFDSKKLSLLREKLCCCPEGGQDGRRPSNMATMCTTIDGTSGRYSRKHSRKEENGVERVEMEKREAVA